VSSTPGRVPDSPVTGNGLGRRKARRLRWRRHASQHFGSAGRFMKHHSRFNIDLTKSFPHLDKAPIVEAVIEIRARAQTLWDEAAITSQLKSRLPDYPNVLSLNAVRQEFTFGPEVTAEAKTHELGWNGLRFQSADN